MYLIVYTWFLIYHVSAGWVYYKYLSERELHKHQGQKDVKEIARFFRLYQLVIVLCWPILLFYGLFKQINRIAKA